MYFLFFKTLKLLFSLFLVATLTFLLMKNIPGDPFADEQGLPAEVHAALMKHYGLDQPVFVQYTDFFKKISLGDLGPSLRHTSLSVNAIIADAFPVSAILGLEALTIALFFGIAGGSIAALYYNKWPDHIMMGIMILGISLPSFILAGFLQYGLAIKLNLFPVARWGSFLQTVLPALSLAILPTAFIARHVRSNMITVLKQNYIRTAYSKGLNERSVIIRHALKNALAPLFSYFGQLIANILAGSFIIEKIYGIPGLGQWFILSINNRDYSVIMGITLFYTTLLLVLLFLADMCYAACDPRVKKLLLREA